MRRFVRPLAIAFATLGLAVGVGAGAAIPAAASVDGSFSASITSGPVFDSDPSLTIKGTKSSSSDILQASTNMQSADQPECTGLGPGTTAFTCTIGFEEPEDDIYNVIFVEQNSDLSVVRHEFSFRVWNDDEAEGADANTAPLLDYVFTPGAVTVDATATNDFDNGVSTEFWTWDGETDLLNCPSDETGYSTDGNPFGENPQSQIACHINLAASESAQGRFATPPLAPYFVGSFEGLFGEGTNLGDPSEGVIFIPHNAIADDRAVPPTFTSDATARTVTISGSVGEAAFDSGGQNADQPGAGVEVLDGNGAVLCGTNQYARIAGTTEFRSFSCTTSALAYGTHTLRAVVVDHGILSDDDVNNALDENDNDGGVYIEGGMSAASTVGTIDFPAPTTPGSGLITPIWSFTVSGDLTNLHPGDTITISGEGLPAGTTLDSVLHSVPTDLGTVVAASDGTFVQTVVIPPDVVIGDHTIQVTATGPGLVSTTKNQAITVTQVPSNSNTGGGGSKPTGTHQAGTNPGGGTTAIQPNILTKALTPIADVAVHPNKIVSALEIGLVLLLLAVLPAHLLNATIAEQSDRFERRFKNVHEPRWLASLIGAIRSAPVVGGLIVAVITGILFGFADPKFGFTLASLRLILGAGIALFLVGYVANWLTAAIARRQWHITVMVNIRPYGIILTVVGVLISRLLDFSPGFLIGLILGLTIQGKSSAGFAWRTVMTRTLIVLAMSVLAWVGYSTITLGKDEGGTFFTALMVETLVAITTEGVVALLVELLPLRFLEGEKLYEHSRLVWGALYLLTVIVFVLAVIPWEGNWDALGSSLWIWIVVLGAFALVCVGVYVYFRRFAKPLEEEAGDEAVPLGETVER